MVSAIGSSNGKLSSESSATFIICSLSIPFSLRYLQNIVFPHMPENGVIVLKNGSAIPVKQFVEEGILSECQTQYNGNIYQYLLEKTKSKFGVLKLKGKKDAVEIEDGVSKSLYSKSAWIRFID